MFDSPGAVIAAMRDREIRFLDLMYVNLYGGLHHVTLPASAVTERTFVEGVGVDGSSIPGFKSLESGDMVVMPDVRSIFEDPFTDHPTFVALCDLAEADTREPARNAPRVIAARAERYLREAGIGSRSMWGPELEYYVFDEVTVRDRPEDCGWTIRSAEAGWGDPRRDADVGLFRFGRGAGTIPAQRGYHAARPADLLYELRAETVRRMEAAGIPVKYHHHEVGAAGQVEIELRFQDLVHAADSIVKGKLIARLTAAEFGLRATFMPKPLYGHAGSGLHFHQHLFDGPRPVFHAEEGYGGLSRDAHAYVAGLLEHGGAVLAFTNPSTNSFRRLVPGYEAPVKAFFSLGNRSAAIRVPRYARAPEAKRIEFRPPDATANPYLAMAAMLLAGVDGIRRKLDPGAMGFGPFDVNVEKLPPEERDRIRSLPGSLDEALDALAADHAFLLAGGVFSEELVRSWIEVHRARARELRARPHPLEFVHSLDA